MRKTIAILSLILAIASRAFAGATFVNEGSWVSSTANCPTSGTTAFPSGGYAYSASPGNEIDYLATGTGAIENPACATVTDSDGDTFTKVQDVGNPAVNSSENQLWVARNVVGSGTNKITCNYANGGNGGGCVEWGNVIEWSGTGSSTPAVDTNGGTQSQQNNATTTLATGSGTSLTYSTDYSVAICEENTDGTGGVDIVSGPTNGYSDAAGTSVTIGYYSTAFSAHNATVGTAAPFTAFTTNINGNSYCSYAALILSSPGPTPTPSATPTATHTAAPTATPTATFVNEGGFSCTSPSTACPSSGTFSFTYPYTATTGNEIDFATTGSGQFANPGCSSVTDSDGDTFYEVFSFGGYLNAAFNDVWAARNVVGSDTNVITCNYTNANNQRPDFGGGGPCVICGNVIEWAGTGTGRPVVDPTFGCSQEINGSTALATGPPIVGGGCSSPLESSNEYSVAICGQNTSVTNSLVSGPSNGYSDAFGASVLVPAMPPFNVSYYFTPFSGYKSPVGTAQPATTFTSGSATNGRSDGTGAWCSYVPLCLGSTCSSPTPSSTPTGGIPTPSSTPTCCW
jgi:hypothetical protein